MSDQRERPKPSGCDSCGFDTSNLEAYARRGPRAGYTPDQKKWLCELCARTSAGNAVDYPDQYPDREVLRAVNYVGNVLLEAISESRRPD